MDVDTGSRDFKVGLLLLVLAVLSVSGIAVFTSAGGTGPSTEGEKGIRVVSVEKEVMASNLGTRYDMRVKLGNGSQMVYERYESHHPLCPEQPEKCGEDSRDPGWGEVNDLVTGNLFRSTGENTYRPVTDVCMVSRTSYREC